MDGFCVFQANPIPLAAAIASQYPGQAEQRGAAAGDAMAISTFGDYVTVGAQHRMSQGN